MAQHRTKQEKKTAQVHRLEIMKTYSLSDLDHDVTLVNKKGAKGSAISSLSLDNNLQFVKTDLIRTGLSLAVTVALLAVGYHFLT